MESNLLHGIRLFRSGSESVSKGRFQQQTKLTASGYQLISCIEMKMKQYSKITFRALFLALFLIPFGGCDFQAAEDAFDDFNIIIGLDPINTVINGILVDASSGDLVAASLTFSGQDESSLIDAYSDPLGDQNAQEGLITFGIQNSRLPSESSPVEFSVTATADGYFTTSQTVSVTSVGDNAFSLVMARENVNSDIQGTDGQVSSQVASNSSGVVQQTVTIQTQAPSSTQTQAQIAVTVPAGSIPLTLSGAPLVGQITTQLRVYDSGAGLAALPSGARTSGDGSNQAIAGATFFKMEDGAGNVAVTFSSGSGKVSAKSGATICDANDTSVVLKSTDSALITALTILGGSADATVHAYQPANGANPAVGTISVTDIAGTAEAEMCLGTANPNIDTSLLTDPSGGIIYTFALTGAAFLSGPLNHLVNVSNPSGAPVTPSFTLVGPGMSHTGDEFISAGGDMFALSALVDFTSDQIVFNGTTYVLTAETGGVTAVADIGTPLSGGPTNLSLPATSGTLLFNVTATVGCPTGETFDVSVTDESLDAVNVFYRADIPGSSWTLLPGSAIASKMADTDSIDITGSISLLPNTSYEFRGVLGTDSAITTQQTPGAAGLWTITMDPDEIGFDCG